MHVVTHTLASTFLAAGDILISKEVDASKLFLIAAGGILVDLDHVVYFGVKNKFNFQNAIKEHNKCNKTSEPRLFLLHSFEAILFFSLMALIYSEMKYFLIGLLAHLLMDVVLYIKRKKGMVWVKMWSISYQLLQKREN